MEKQQQSNQKAKTPRRKKEKNPNGLKDLPNPNGLPGGNNPGGNNPGGNNPGGNKSQVPTYWTNNPNNSQVPTSNSQDINLDFSKITDEGPVGDPDRWPNATKCMKLMEEAKEEYSKTEMSKHFKLEQIDTNIGHQAHKCLKLGNKYFDPSLSDNIGMKFGKTNVPIGQKWFTEAEHQAIRKVVASWSLGVVKE